MYKMQFDVISEIYVENDEDLPLQLVLFLFDVLKSSNNFVVKNIFVDKASFDNLINGEFNEKPNLLFTISNKKSYSYILWIKKAILSNRQLIDIFLTQAMSLSYIIPKDSFDVNKLISNLKRNDFNLIENDMASFVCNIPSPDRELIFGFNSNDYSIDQVNNAIRNWLLKIQNSYGKKMEVVIEYRDKAIDYSNFDFVRKNYYAYCIKFVEDTCHK